MNDRLKLDIYNIYNSNSNIVSKKINSIISSVRNFNTKLLNELSKLNNIIANNDETRRVNIKIKIDEMHNLIKTFNYENYKNNIMNKINTISNLQKALKLNNLNKNNRNNTFINKNTNNIYSTVNTTNNLS